MNDAFYELVIYWDQADRIFVVEVPELPGCMTHGATRTEAVQNAEEAIALWVQTAQEDGLPIPQPKGKLMYA